MGEHCATLAAAAMAARARKLAAVTSVLGAAGLVALRAGFARCCKDRGGLGPADETEAYRAGVNMAVRDAWKNLVSPCID